MRVATAVAVAACVAGGAAPAAGAGPASDLLGQVNQTVNDAVGGLLEAGGASGTPSVPSPGGSAGPAPSPAPAPQAAEVDPPLSGTNPHGQGEVLDVGVGTPLLDPIEVVVGQSRGEQDADGSYRGRVTIASVPLLGLELAFETDESNPSASSPLDPVNQGVLDGLCGASTVCLAVLEFSSETDDRGSRNSFSVVSADVGDGAVAAGVAESEGNISETNRCQTATGSSSVADAGALGLVDADVLQSSSRSRACRGEDPVAEGDSSVLGLNGNQPLDGIGCGSGVDEEFSIPLVVDGVCNGDDTNGSQADAPYNVRKALGLDLLGVLNTAGIFLDLDASTSESLAEAPGAPRQPGECPDPSNRDCPSPPTVDCPERGDGQDPDCPGSGRSPEGPGGPGGGGPSGDAPNGRLPFTGADLGFMGLVGLLVAGSGLALMALADRRRRTVV